MLSLVWDTSFKTKEVFSGKKRSSYYFKPFSGCCRPYRTLQIKVKLPAFVPPEMQSVITCVMCNVFCFFNASVPSSDGTQNLLWGFVLTKPHNSDYFYSCAQIKYKSVNLKKVHINFFFN